MRHGWISVLALTACSGSGSSSGGGGGGSAGGGAGGGSGGAGPAIQFTASGEVLALGGYGFPPATADDAAFVDGWEVRFSKFLVTIDKITLSESPDTAPSDQSKTGKLVAEVDGPWAIDLHKGGPITGKGGSDEQAYPVTTLDNQNKNGGAPFDPSQRYAFGFDIVPATASATRLQLDAEDPDYQEMITQGYAVLYVGTATWHGGTACSTTGTFPTGFPTQVDFRLGFKTPTTYINCQNPDNDPAQGLAGEDHQRGVQPKAGQTVIAQVTVHTDHPFWESFVHDTPAHFDQLAAIAKSQADGGLLVHTEDAVGVDYTAFSYQSMPLPWRSCLAGYTPPNTSPQMGFDSLSIPHNPSGDPSTSMRDYADYMAYDQSTQGHLNSDGLCFVSRHYPSPP